jgi:hypothetical protein
MDRRARAGDTVLVKSSGWEQNTAMVAGGRRGKDDRKQPGWLHIPSQLGNLFSASSLKKQATPRVLK